MQVNAPILIGVIGYNLIVIIIMNVFLKIRERNSKLKGDFMFSGGNLPFYVVGATQALTILGGGHIMGVTGQAQITGLATFFYPLAHAGAMFLILYYYGPWVRRMGFQTVGQALTTMWNPAVRPLMTGGTVACCFAILTLETQGLGAIFAIVTGIEVWQGCIIGAAIGFIYVFVAGMKEVGWVNVANALLMYVVCIIALAIFGVRMQGGWNAVNVYYNSNGMSDLLRIFGNAEIMRTYVFGAIFSVIFGTTLTQATVQTSISAKSVKECRKAALVAIPANVLFGAIAVIMGMASKAMGYGEGGGTPVFAMAIDLLPTWMAFMLLGVFLAAILSTFAMMLLGLSTCLTFDIQKAYFWKESTQKKETLWVRIWIVVLTVLACVVAAYLPSVSAGITWGTSWMTPLCIMFIIGMCFKRSNAGAIATIVICWIVNTLFSLTNLMQILHIDGNNYAPAMCVLSLVLGLIFTALDKNAKPAFYRVYRKQREEWNVAHGITACAKQKGRN